MSRGSSPEALADDVSGLEATTAAEDGWVDTVVGRSAGTADRARSCTPGYYNREGQANATTRQGSFFIGTPTEYADTLAAWRDDGTLDGLDIARGGRLMTKRYLTGRIRAALRRRPSPRVAIIGAGFGGLAAAVALRRIGVDDLVIIERGDGVGGTWRQNTYPGAACDIQSHLYSFSFAPNRNWSRTYARQPEILAYLESVAETFDLNRHLLTGTETVRSMRWNREASGSGISISNPSPAGAVSATPPMWWSARSACSANRSCPRSTGSTDFTGSVMHTSRWDARAELTGCRVAVIGTGASAMQVVPELAEDRRHGDGLPANSTVDGAQGRPRVHRS